MTTMNITEIPVLLIQALHERQEGIQEALASLHEQQRVFMTREVQLKSELDRLEALLQAYPLLASVAVADEAPQQDAPCLEEGGEAVPPSDAPPRLAVQDCVDAMLRDDGPAGAAYLRRKLMEQHGLNVAKSTLYDLLMAGQREGRYRKHGLIWCLALEKE